MKPLRVLLAGETWITHSTHIKGVDSFSTSLLESGATALIEALVDEGTCEVHHLMGHDVPERFPDSYEALSAYDVVLLSDIGARSFALHPDIWLRGLPRVDRLAVLRDWVAAGGGLGMMGGYLSFQGLDAAAKYAGTAVSEALPVVVDRHDDCVEVPNGAVPTVEASHPMLDGVPQDWRLLLGYNRVTARPDANVLCRINGDPLLVVGRYGEGRSLAWTSDVGPHWCPADFCNWDGFGTLWRNAAQWLGGSAAPSEIKAAGYSA